MALPNFQPDQLVNLILVDQKLHSFDNSSYYLSRLKKIHNSFLERFPLTFTLVLFRLGKVELKPAGTRSSCMRRVELTRRRIRSTARQRSWRAAQLWWRQSGRRMGPASKRKHIRNKINWRTFNKIIKMKWKKERKNCLDDFQVQRLCELF